MRLLESRLYRGKKIRIYLIAPGEGARGYSSLAVWIDGAVIATPELPQGTQIGEALGWARGQIDRLLGYNGPKLSGV